MLREGAQPGVALEWGAEGARDARQGQRGDAHVGGEYRHIACQRLDGRTHELEQVDAEARAIVQALDEGKTLEELLSSGLSARCPNCAELVAKRERFCASCGAEVSRAQPPGPRPPAGRPSHTAAPAAMVTGASSGRSPSPPAR